ncbi:MAG: hypothetical protein MZV70_25640 [Desulfobacterales bacterium]|nr:hypothetical protein [Desulfobacterales bacterium]
MAELEIVFAIYQRRRSKSRTGRLSIEKVFWPALSLEFPFFEGGLRMAELNEAKAKATAGPAGL